MNKTRILCVINPAAGKQYPILAVLNKRLSGEKFDWAVVVTKKDVSLKDQFADIKLKKFDAVCVYGGDGTVNDVCNEVRAINIPLLILHGGTANTFARELGISQDPDTVLQQFISDQMTVKTIVTGEVNDTFFLSAVLIGPLAEINQLTSRKTKDKLGVLAYVKTLFENIPLTETSRFTLKMDAETAEVEALGLVVLNHRFAGFGSFKVSDQTSVEDDEFVIAAIPSVSPQKIIEGFLHAITENSLDSFTQTWRARSVSILCDQKQTIVSDETRLTAQKIKVSLSSDPIRVFVPKQQF